MADLSILDAMMLIEDIEDASVDNQLQAWQKLVDSGLVWQLQGWYGRTAEQLIEQGLIHA
jgi:hypothetical protein